MTTSEIVAPTVEVAPVREYTDDEKTQLANVVARELYNGFVHDLFFQEVVENLRQVVGDELKWFELADNVFPQLESIGVKGAFDFNLTLKARHYLRSCFPEKFHKWFFVQRLKGVIPFDVFMRAYEKVKPFKPDPRVIYGRRSTESGRPRNNSTFYI